MAVKNQSSKGKKLLTALLCVGVAGAAGIGLLAARFFSGRGIFDMTRQSVTDNISPTQIEEPEQEQETEPTERYSGIDNDRTYFRDENGTIIDAIGTVDTKNHSSQIL